MLRAIYPGSFDPVTNGHLDLIERAAKFSDELIVGVLRNKAKTSLFSVEERVKMLKEVTKHLENVTIRTFDGMLVDFSREMEAHVIIRGLRGSTDYEYESQMAQINRSLSSDVETLFMTTSPEYGYISSSMVKEIASFGGEITPYVPSGVALQIKEKIK